MRKTYIALIMLGLILAPNNLKAKVHPDEKTFTEDRIDCISQEFDMRQVYAHKNTNPVPEGVNVFERPSLKLKLIWQTFAPNRIYNPKMDKYFVVKKGTARKVSRDNFEAEFHKYWKGAPVVGFIVVWRECVKQQGNKPH